MFQKFGASLPSSLIDAVSGVMYEAKADEPNAPDPEAIARKKRLDAIRDKREADADENSYTRETPVRKVAGRAYGGSNQKDDDDDVNEELKGNQHKIDANKNGKIDAHDFKLLRDKNKQGPKTSPIGKMGNISFNKQEQVEYDELILDLREADDSKTDLPFEPDENPKKSAIPGKHGYGASLAKHLARQAMQKRMKKETMMGKAGTTSEETEIDEAALTHNIYNAGVETRDDNGGRVHRVHRVTVKRGDNEEDRVKSAVAKHYGDEKHEITSIQKGQFNRKQPQWNKGISEESGIEESRGHKILATKLKQIASRSINQNTIDKIKDDENTKQVQIVKQKDTSVSTPNYKGYAQDKMSNEEVTHVVHTLQPKGDGDVAGPKIKITAKDNKEAWAEAEKHVSKLRGHYIDKVVPISEKLDEVSADLIGRYSVEEADLEEAVGTAAKYAGKKGFVGDKYTSVDRMMDMKNFNKIRDQRAAQRNAEHEKQDPKMAAAGYAKHMVDTDKAKKKASKRGVDASHLNWKHRSGVVSGKLPEEELNLEDYSLEELEDFMMSEDFEQLDELSKKTLGSYIKKASDPGSEKSNVNLGARAAYAGFTPDGDKDDKKAYHRSKGIGRAADKLTREEVEEMDESIMGQAKHLVKGIKRAVAGKPSAAASEKDAANRAEKSFSNAAAHFSTADDVTMKAINRGSDDDVKRAAKVRANRMSAGRANMKQGEQQLRRSERISALRNKVKNEELENLDETATLDRYIKSMGYDPKNMNKNKKVMFSKTNSFKSWASSRNESLYDAGQKGTQDIEAGISPGATARG